MKTWTIVLIEFSMLVCVAIAADLLPGAIPLKAFMAASSEFLLIGNFLLVKAIELHRAKTAITANSVWSRILLVFVIIDFPWVISQFR
ncbi:MAG: hypothetical protein WAL75_15390 [Terracidiphilus sp.]